MTTPKLYRAVSVEDRLPETGMYLTDLGWMQYYAYGDMPGGGNVWCKPNMGQIIDPEYWLEPVENDPYEMVKAQELTVDLCNHSYNFFNPEEERGRKIWFYGLPATVEPSSYYPGEIHIVPDYTHVSKDEWWDRYRKARPWDSEEDDDDDDRLTDKIVWGSALSDGNIWWWRDDKNNQ